MQALKSPVVIALLALVALGYLFVTQTQIEAPLAPVRQSWADAERELESPNVASVVEMKGDSSEETSFPSPADVARWVQETNSPRRDTRAAAILALAQAQKSEAIYALRRVLEGGEPSIDRPLAVQSLRDLALNQGDSDGVIRSIVRETIYHSDDDTLVESAQLALEIIEESEMQ